MKAKYAFFLLSVIFSLSCRKSAPQPPLITDVYVVGSILATNNMAVATIWKNGVATRLADSSTNTFASAITIQGNDIYVAGFSDDGGARAAVYWKNGVRVTLGPGEALSITVLGQDVYVAGQDGSLLSANYWKNGIQTSLAGRPSTTYAQAIGVKGNDVYVAGATDSTTNLLRAMCWENNAPVFLADNPYGSVSDGIAIDGNDVYFGGYITGLMGNNPVTACYWKNGAAFPVSGNSQFFFDARAIAVNGTDIYLAGLGSNNANYNTIATYSKNGTAAMLCNTSSDAEGIAVVSHN